MTDSTPCHIAVFGGAGYIGAHTVRELLDRGYRVSVFDNLSTGSQHNLQVEAQFTLGDIRDQQEVSRFFSDFSIISRNPSPQSDSIYCLNSAGIHSAQAYPCNLLSYQNKYSSSPIHHHYKYKVCPSSSLKR